MYPSFLVIYVHDRIFWPRNMFLWSFPPPLSQSLKCHKAILQLIQFRYTETRLLWIAEFISGVPSFPPFNRSSVTGAVLRLLQFPDSLH